MADFVFAGKVKKNAKGTIYCITSGNFLKEVATVFYNAVKAGKPVGIFISKGQNGPGCSVAALEPRGPAQGAAPKTDSGFDSIFGAPAAGAPAPTTAVEDLFATPPAAPAVKDDDIPF